MDRPDSSAAITALVVDDNTDHVDTLAVLLELLGCKARVAYDGRIAVQLFHHVRPDVVFLDLDMPGLDGCDAALLLQADDLQGRTVLVCLTGRSEPLDQERCRRSGFDFFFSKPIEERQLMIVLEAVRTRRAMADLSAAPPPPLGPRPLP